jgi:hypothetical protein
MCERNLVRGDATGGWHLVHTRPGSEHQHRCHFEGQAKRATQLGAKQREEASEKRSRREHLEGMREHEEEFEREKKTEWDFYETKE